ncbi:hypothetical protein [Aquimarina mytili]|uniref:TonB C-terminal domain-containing protein n=1 Tax=Aquimarina mytili TaxID=874423 RepID=A0A937DB15_9FLAO|nr:hypothetical protein [Aquimarina mytili]MBL0684118.1 hypothetical protein [Aquimarina mytili]
MRKSIILLLLLLSTIVYGQEDIQEVLKQDVCECFGEKTKRSLNADNMYVFKLCLLAKIKNYSEEFQTILKEERFVEVSKRKGQDYDINLRNLGLFIAGHLEYFIQDCDVYYLYSSALRIQELTIRAGTYRFEKAMLSRKLKEPGNNPKLFYERGMTYLAIGQYEKAKQDFYKCLDTDPNNEKAIYSLGWACELNEEFGVAIGWYKELTKKGNRYDAAKALEITKRKVKDKEAFESLKTLNQLIALKSASISKRKKSIPEGNSVPVMQGCEGLTDQNEIKKCMSELVKKHVNENFDGDMVMNNSSLRNGKHTIHAAFKISKEGKIKDIKVLFNDPFAIFETKRVLNSLPPILKPGMTAEGKPVSVYYSLPINFIISYE